MASPFEQCSDCRGVFLDRGELDRMIDNESRRYEEPSRVVQPVPNYEYRNDHSFKKKKKHGFLSELFDD